MGSCELFTFFASLSIDEHQIAGVRNHVQAIPGHADRVLLPQEISQTKKRPDQALPPEDWRDFALLVFFAIEPLDQKSRAERCDSRKSDDFPEPVIVLERHEAIGTQREG